MVGHGLRMISGRSGNQSALSFVGSQAQKFVQSAAFLERACALEILQFKKNWTPRQPGEGMRVPTRRDGNGLANAFSCFLNATQRYCGSILTMLRNRNSVDGFSLHEPHRGVSPVALSRNE